MEAAGRVSMRWPWWVSVDQHELLVLLPSAWIRGSDEAVRPLLLESVSHPHARGSASDGPAGEQQFVACGSGPVCPDGELVTPQLESDAGGDGHGRGVECDVSEW